MEKTETAKMNLYKKISWYQLLLHAHFYLHHCNIYIFILHIYIVNIRMLTSAALSPSKYWE